MFWNSKKKLKILAFEGGAQKAMVSVIIAKALGGAIKKNRSKKKSYRLF